MSRPRRQGDHRQDSSTSGEYPACATRPRRRQGDHRQDGSTSGEYPACATRPRRQGDHGQVGGIEVLPFGFLIFVSVTLLIANAWGVIDAKLAVTSAAHEGVRAYVEADNATTAATAARQRAAETLNGYGRGGARATIGTPVLNGDFRRCARVTLTVSYDLPIVAVPFIGGLGRLKPVTSTLTEVVDPFRSGLPVSNRDVQC